MDQLELEPKFPPCKSGALPLTPQARTETVAQTCATCKRAFQARVAELRRGNGKFCSLKCSANRPRSPKPPNTSCSFCGTALYRSPSQQARSKHGKIFCDRKCKENAQKDPSYGISPSHYGTGNGQHSYRAAALSALPNKCNRCDYAKRVDVLQVHHKDSNRENNTLDNLEILCPTCHVAHHIDCKRTL